MRYTIDRAGRVPAYIQLYRELREDIVKGVYPFGSRLPSKRTLAEESGVGTVTVENAYALLCDEGYAEPRERSGYFVIFRESDGFEEPAESPRRAVAPEPSGSYAPEFPYTLLAKTMRRVLGDRPEDALFGRAPGAGRTELREALRRYLVRSRGIEADVSQIVIGSGAEYLYGLTVRLLGRDKVYAIESPSYRKIEQVYRSSDVRCELLPLGADGIESAALRASRADVLHITPYRSFPSGVTASASKRHEYLRWAEGGRIIVEDDFESEFSVSRKPQEPLFSTAPDGRVIYINTFSRTISPALRIGYMVLPKRLVPEFSEKLGFLSCTVPTFEQLVLAELITSGDFERNINRVRRKKRRELAEKQA